MQGVAKGAKEMDTIGGLSRKTGCHIETIRYYERIGLLSKPPRTEGGHRLYNKEQIKRLVFIRRSRELGFSLDEIRTLFRLVDGERSTCQEVKTVTEQHLQDVSKKISDLRKLQKTLRAISSQCEGGLVPDCPIIESLFEEKRL
ncbi:MAG TPA: transcriptional regulator [Nitrospiraceae bacterium]|nr:transcriptional regulator [Nitrospiraceae bacterium]